MPLPNFLILGAAKAGTSWLARNLAQHPAIYIGRPDAFFDCPVNFAKGTDWYRRYFDAAGAATAIGEKTASYLWCERLEKADPDVVPRRVLQVIPQVRLVAILRNPVPRAISNVNYAIQTGHLSPLLDINDVLTGRCEPHRGTQILERGLYARQIERWLRYFPREQLRVILLERDVVQRSERTLRELCEFLEVDPTFQFRTAENQVNRRRSKAEMVLSYYARPLRKLLAPILRLLPHEGFQVRPETRAFLYHYYADENRKLQQMMGFDLSCWCESPGTRAA